MLSTKILLIRITFYELDVGGGNPMSRAESPLLSYIRDHAIIKKLFMEVSLGFPQAPVTQLASN